jgi:hypothetical protein
MPSDFDWDEIADDVVVPEQAAIAVYTNPKGHIVIRQAGQYGPDEDQWIVVAPMHALALAQAIAHAAGDDLAASESPAPKDRTAAERQRRYRARNVTPRHAVTDGENVLPLMAAE